MQVVNTRKDRVMIGIGVQYDNHEENCILIDCLECSEKTFYFMILKMIQAGQQTWNWARKLNEREITKLTNKRRIIVFPITESDLKI